VAESYFDTWQFFLYMKIKKFQKISKILKNHKLTCGKNLI